MSDSLFLTSIQPASAGLISSGEAVVPGDISWRHQYSEQYFFFIIDCWHNLSKVEYLSMFFHLGLTNTLHGRNISLVHWIGSRYADSQVDFYDKDLPLKDNMLQYCCKDMTEVGKTIRKRLSDTFACEYASINNSDENWQYELMNESCSIF